MVKPKLMVRPPPSPLDPDIARQFIATGDIPESPEVPTNIQEHSQTSADIQDTAAEPPPEALPQQPPAEVHKPSQTSADTQDTPHIEPRPEIIPPPVETVPSVHELPQTSVSTSRKRAPKGSKVLIEREGGRIRRRITLYLPPELADQFMAWCSSNGREASHAAAEAIAAFLKARRGK